MPSGFFRFLLMAFAALGLAAVLSVPARAQQNVQAVVTTDLNMREGPGTRYRVVLTLPNGARVVTLRCTDRYEWCEVGYAGRTGWVSARYLRDTRPAYRDRPISDIGSTLGLKLFDFVMRELDDRRRDDTAFDNDDRFDGDRRPTPRNVCFYDRPNFQGRRLCAGIGDDARVMDRNWDGRVASIRVGERTSVEICSRIDFAGRCDLLTRDVSSLRRGDTVSSFRVYRRRPGDEGSYDRVRRACFYERVDFRGASICFDAGDGTARLPREWNNRISSVTLEGGAEARVCERRNFGGWCETIRRDTRRLRDIYNDDISSIEVF
ncbi:peptidase inhibitor family I36 protein [Nitratireductor aquimarinus]|uniref:peptidase inhibitor family I36 protein n=1 Tax=Nitratireductor TaxID=245876 RepID=UPI0019D373D9|nr:MULTISPECIES: peptidase inhibitor family I36 protein [Nitratireductor]MBN7774866.1 peptidase inhibitor family I36 protein [Nitratireductor pacificus]MBN7779727.1 peptidase inhibitor family I36 protein [Nitratireductor pacificus]MBN7788534.1 peptidase inhibitor family I36 protein [Nitratireductor aquimarinus]MBY6097253.1 peptidase inhibitor family I36 protein [Nitratireductor aquimarinus]MCA1262075.1 peptidase inhibitor family I36 protein [Nitratireductor aquimarinus]